MVTKKILIGALLILVSVIGIKAFAHSRLSKEENVKHITEKMAKKLSLTEEQKAKVFQINLERANGHEDAYNQGRKKEVIRNAVAKWRTDLKQVLTAEQAQKLKI
jgi:Spy/CpxP family protein refolding chaperone